MQPTALLLFGFGDGGGGPTEVMLQNLRRARAITNAGHVEMPKVTTGQSAREFFDHLRTTTKEGARLPTWQGEIYLEFHRGVYTSHGSIKKGNRRSEILMHNLEWAATLASLSKGAEYSYPKEEIDKLWEHVLLNQFHDVLPGSSIRKVYDDAERIYRDIKEKGGKLLRMAVDALGSDARNEGGIMALNTLGIPRRELVRVPSSDATSSDGPDADLVRANAVQTCEDGTHLLLLEDVLASGSARSTSGLQTMRSLEAVCVTQTGHNAYTMRNAFIAVTVEKGRITSINDHASRREVLAKGRTAGLTICEDYPPTFDAWETESEYPAHVFLLPFRCPLTRPRLALARPPSVLFCSLLSRHDGRDPIRRSPHHRTWTVARKSRARSPVREQHGSDHDQS